MRPRRIAASFRSSGGSAIFCSIRPASVGSIRSCRRQRVCATRSRMRSLTRLRKSGARPGCHRRRRTGLRCSAPSRSRRGLPGGVLALGPPQSWRPALAWNPEPSTWPARLALSGCEERGLFRHADRQHKHPMVCILSCLLPPNSRPRSERQLDPPSSVPSTRSPSAAVECRQWRRPLALTFISRG